MDPDVAQVFDALGDGTRRAIVDRLRTGPLAVGVIADDLPVSRPAVSKHLKILKAAGVVTDRQVGTRRLYALDLDALAAARAELDRFWDDALARFGRLAERTEERS